MRKGTAKNGYPRTLLADVLCLLMGCLGLNAYQLAGLADENRGTVSHVLRTTQPCKEALLRGLCVALLPGRDAQPLINAFMGDCAAVLSIPQLLVQLEPQFAAHRQAALKLGLDIGALCCKSGQPGLNFFPINLGLDIGALCGGYSPEAIDADAATMEQLGRWPIACRWAGYAVAVARQTGDTCTELKAGLRQARLLLASSRFAECETALKSFFDHPVHQAGEALPRTARTTDPHTLLRASGEIYRSWLHYELGQYPRACAGLAGATESLVALTGQPPCAGTDGKAALALPVLSAVAGRSDMAGLLDLALH